MRWIVVAFFLSVCTAATASGQVDTSIVPYEGRTTWAPGVQSGIPARTTVCATLKASEFGNGRQEASAAIQAAINSCPLGRTVALSAGTFLMNHYVLLNKGITLRGAGPGQTKLVKTNGAKPNDYRPEDASPNVVVGPNRWPKVDNTTSVNLMADALKGQNVVEVTSAAGFAPGQFVLLDEDDYSAATWTPLPNRLGAKINATILATDRVVFQQHNPSEPGVDDPFPGSLSWFSRPGRPLSEIKEVVAVSGNRITFSTPVHITYTTSKIAQLTRYTGEHAHVRDAGLEALTVSGGGDGNIRIEAAAYSWVKDVEDTLWLGEAIGVNHSFRVEIRDSFIHDGVWSYPGGGGYGISLAADTSEVLIENNIVNKVNKVMVVRSSGAGSVVGYNYMDNGYIENALSWVEVGLNGSHMVGSHHVLFEGNESFNYDSDNTHGNAIYMTVFRNHLSGFRRDYPGTSNARTAGLNYGSWWHSFVANVLGVSGAMTGWGYENSFPWNSKYIWELGYQSGQWDQAADPKVLSTVLRGGNFDYVTNTVHWESIAPQTIPSSLYLSAKPAFFGTYAWPWVDPTGVVKLATLPAKARFDAGTPFAPPPGSAPTAPTGLRIRG